MSINSKLVATAAKLLQRLTRRHRSILLSMTLLRACCQESSFAFAMDKSYHSSEA